MKTHMTLTTLNKRLRHGAVVVAFLLLMAGMAQAQVTNVIYQDNFARVGVLNGSTPDTVDNWYTNASGASFYTNANGNASWFAADAPNINSQLLTDGSEIACTNWPNSTNGFFLNAFLPFSPLVGHKYIFTVNVYGILGPANNWLAAGFSQNEITNNFYAAANAGVAWYLVRAALNNAYQCFLGPGTGGSFTGSAGANGGTNNFQVVLDTTTGTISSGWTVTWYCNGVVVKVNTYGANPTFRAVGVGANTATGYFQDFSLLDVVYPPSTPVINEQPQNATVSVGQTATFWVNAVGVPAPAYQWNTNSAGGPTNAIVGATGAVYTTPPLTPAYNGLLYSVTVTNTQGSTNSAPATLTVANTPATVFSVVKAYPGLTNALTNVVVTFSKPVEPITALNPANYTLNNGATVSAVNYGSASNNVILLTSTLNTNFGYNLSISNVADFYSHTMTGATMPVLPANLSLYLRGDSGVILDNSGNVAEWLDQTTNANNAVQYVLGGPSSRPVPGTLGGKPAVSFNGTLDYLTAATSPSLAITNNFSIYALVNFADLSLTREIVSKNTGVNAAPYEYYVNNSAPASDVLLRGEGQNVGSSTGTPDLQSGNSYVLAANMMGITNGGLQGSGTVAHYLNGLPNGSSTLTVAAPSFIFDTGTPLWIGGRDDLSQWMDGQMGEIMIFNGALSLPDMTNVDNYLGQKYYSFTITTNLSASTTSSNGFVVTYIFGASQGSTHLSYQWQENGTNIPGANSSVYVTPTLGPPQSNVTYDVVATLPNGTTYTSVINTLTVLPAPPFVTGVGIPIWNTNQLYVTFDDSVNPVTATTAANYSLNNGASVLSAVIGDAPNKVVLTTSPLTWAANPGYYSLTVSNVQDLYGETNITATSPVTLYPFGTALWLEGNAGVVTDPSGNPVLPGTAIDEWDDQSGNQANLYQGSALSGFSTYCDPLLTTNYHGNVGLSFVGTNTITVGGNGYTTFMWSANTGGNDYPCLEITNDMTIFSAITFGSFTGEIVGKTGAGANANRPSTYDYYYGSAPSATLYRGNGGASIAAVSSSTTPGIILNVPHVVGVVQQGQLVSHYADGVTNGTGINSVAESLYVDQGQTVQIGMRLDRVNHLVGQLNELIMVPSALDSSDVSNLQAYLTAKYDVPTGTNSYIRITSTPAPNPTNVLQSTTLTLPVGVVGNPVTMQWYSTNGTAIAGQTSNTLVISNIQATNSYYLVLTNTFMNTAVTSSVVVVNVIPANPNPTNITFSATNNQLTLSWPADHVTGWHLQAQTNNVSVGISTNWATYTPSIGTNKVVISNLTNGTVFYRLIFP